MARLMVYRLGACSERNTLYNTRIIAYVGGAAKHAQMMRLLAFTLDPSKTGGAGALAWALLACG